MYLFSDIFQKTKIIISSPGPCSERAGQHPLANQNTQHFALQSAKDRNNMMQETDNKFQFRKLHYNTTEKKLIKYENPSFVS